MRTKIFLTVSLVATMCYGRDPALDALAAMKPIPGVPPSGDAAQVARMQAAYPPLPLELPAETDARRALLMLRDQLIAAKRLTPDLDTQIAAQISAILAAEAARIQNQLTLPQPQVIVIDRR